MNDEHRLTIGNLTFHLSSPNLPLAMEVSPAYRPFFAGEPGSDPLVSVRILEEAMPSPEGLEKVFDSGETWALYRDGGVLLIVFASRETNAPPRWVARVDVAGRRVDVFCGGEIVKAREGGKVVVNPLLYPLDQILLMIFLGGEGFTVHAAGAIFGGKGIMLPGVSGAGKSTVTGLLARDERFRLLSDDRVVLRRVNEVLRVFGSPWPGDAGVAANDEAILSAMLFLGKGGRATIQPLDREDALRRLLPVISVPWYDREITETSLSFCEQLLDAVPAFELGFRLDSPVADMVGEFASTL